MNLTVDMRPKHWDDVVGLDAQIAVLRKTIAEGKLKPVLLTGDYGCGKTTLSKLIAKEAQGWDSSGEPQITEVNAANVRGIAEMRKIVEDSWTHPMFGGTYQVIILNEAQQLTKDAQQVLLDEFEKTNVPSIWVLTTTDPQKINQGIRDRCLALPPLTGLDAEGRAKLVQKAIEFTGYKGDVSEFLTELSKAKIFSPRKILKCFEGLFNGLSPKDAISTASLEALPEYFEIAMGVVFGQWDKPYTLSWLKEKSGELKKFKGVGEQLKALDDRLKRKPKAEDAAESAEDDNSIEESDVEGKPDVARALRAIVAASLKNQVFKGGDKAQKGAAALFKLAHCVSSNPFDTGSEWACTIGGLYSVHQVMQGK